MKKLYSLRFFTLYLLTLTSAVQAQTRTDDQLVAYFPFSEGAGSFVLDQSGYGEPLLLRIYDPAAVHWLPGGGLSVDQATLIKSLSGTEKISEACQLSQEISMEVWVKCANSTQDGPARILTASNGTGNRNWMLAQTTNKFQARLRTSSGSTNGTPNLESPSGSASNQLKHLVYTRMANGQEKLYVNGSHVSSSTRTGDFSNWISSFDLALANEIDASRPWLGEIHLCAIYSKSLSPSEVAANHSAGPNQSGNSLSENNCDQSNCFVDGFGANQRVIWLPNVPTSNTNEYQFDVGGGHFDVFPDGRAHLYGATEYINNPAMGWYIDVWFTDRMNWTEWSALGRTWKGSPAIVGNLYQTWDYFIMDVNAFNVMIGLGDFEGSTLNLTHRPSNYQYGFQVGVAANDQNSLPGMSCWFDYTGTINGSTVNDHGDFNMEGECINLPVLECVNDLTLSCESDYLPATSGTPTILCEQEYVLTYEDQISGSPCSTIITRTWTATSSSGSTAMCTQIITLTDTEAPVLSPMPQIIGDCSFVNEWTPTALDNCDPSPVVTITYTAEDWTNSSDCTPGMYRTQTQGGWGTNPNGNNPGVYLTQHFDEVFPDGLTIGCNNTLTLTTAQAVIDFLPSGTSPTILPAGSLTNPGSGYSNVLAGQLVAATLSTAFDAADENFGSAFPDLGMLTLAEGSMAGLTVNELLQIANAFIGGCSTAYSASEINGALSSFNENFVDGTTSNGFVDCSGGLDCYLAINVVITATDACGNTSTLEQQVILNDSMLPVFPTTPEELYVECDAIPPISTDFIDPCFTELVDVEVQETSFSGACLPTIERVYTLTDQCGNTTTFTQYIFVHDSTAPVFVEQPADISLECGEAVPAFIPQVTDNCDPAPQLVFSEYSTVNGCVHTIVRTWTATDQCGNSTMIEQLLTITDNAGPVANGFVPMIEIECGEVPSADLVSFSDQCGAVVSVTVDIQVEGADCDRTITRIWTATDDCGNVTIAVQQILVADHTPPVITEIPASINLACGSPLPVIEPAAADNCSAVTLIYSESTISSGSCQQVQRIWTARDECDNEAMVMQTVVFLDEEPPSLFGIPQDMQVGCGQLPAWSLVTASDNCDLNVTVTSAEYFIEVNCGLMITRTWTATDACGNSTTDQQIISLQDNQPPVFSSPVEVNVSCQLLSSLSVSVSDDCTAAPQISYSDVELETGCNFTIERTWIAVDGCNNSSSFQQLIHVSDNQGPVFVSVPPSFTISCGTVPFYEEPIVFDQCGSGVTLTMVESTQGSGCSQQLIRTWTATDACGNQTLAQQVITIADLVPPVVTNVPASMTFPCEMYTPQPVPAGIGASDNCGGMPTIMFNETTIPGNCPGNFQVVRSWTATDNCGNAATAYQVIQVIDTTPPVFDFIPQDVFAECENIPEPITLTATDNCSVVVTVEMTQATLTGGCPIIQRIWVATDECGNSSSVTQQIHISDDEPPLLQGIPPGGPVSCTNIPPTPEPYAVDNCDDLVDISMNETIIGSGCEYILVRTFIAEDDCGNAVVVSQTFEVTDESPPFFLNPQPEISLSCSALPNYQGPAVNDDCGSNVVLSFTQNIIGGGCNYDVVRVYSATDLCGNSTSVTQVIHVFDNAAPVISGVPASTLVNCQSVPAPAQPVAIDGCGGIVPVQFTQTQNGAGCGVQIIRTWTATDACGNTAIAVQILTLIDLVAPVLSGVPASVTITCEDAIPTVAVVSATDNCGQAGASIGVQFTQTIAIHPCSRVITRTWTSSDACGNVATVSRTITINDFAAPSFVNAPVDVTVDCNEIPVLPVLVATDGCSPIVTMTFEEEWITGVCPYQIIRTWVASDPCGNTRTHQQIISVLDNAFPELALAPANATVECGNVPTPVQMIASDNCRGNFLASFNETTIEGECGYELIRTWTAADYCGNVVTREQVIQVIDTQAPVFAFQPEDIMVECGDSFDVFVPIAADCSDYTMSYAEYTIDSDCPGVYQLIQTWTATDQCDNVSFISRKVIFADHSAPVLSELPENLTVPCSEIPPAAVITAYDQCEGELEVSFTEEYEFYGEEDGSCVLNNAVNFYSEVAVWLPNIPGLSSDWVFAEAPGTFIRDEVNGTAEVMGTVYNTTHPEYGWQIHLILAIERNWSEWSALGRSYKNDVNLAGNNYLDWSFYELQPGSSLTGVGALAGSSLALTHAPWHYYYGFQLGYGANNRNADYGLSGWFYYTGTVNGESMNGTGDLFVSNECCPEQDIIRTWMVQDCAGNVTIHTQEIFVTNGFNPYAFEVQEPEMFNAFDVTGSTDDFFTLRYEMYFAGEVDIVMYDEMGRELNRIFSGHVEGQTPYVNRVPKAGLSPGAYFFTLRQSHTTLSDREMVLSHR